MNILLSQRAIEALSAAPLPVQKAFIKQLNFRRRDHSAFRRPGKLIQVRNREPANSVPSRTSVRAEIASPRPKQPQSICIPLAYALTINPKNTSSSSDAAAAETRSQRPP